jgi:hypothetical protein
MAEGPGAAAELLTLGSSSMAQNSPPEMVPLAAAREEGTFSGSCVAAAGDARWWCCCPPMSLLEALMPRGPTPMSFRGPSCDAEGGGTAAASSVALTCTGRQGPRR